MKMMSWSQEQQPADTDRLDAVPLDSSVRIEPVAGVKNGEPALIVTSGNGHVSLLVSDVIMNNAKGSIVISAATGWLRGRRQGGTGLSNDVCEGQARPEGTARTLGRTAPLVPVPASTQRAGV
jgi:hypothetical protein